MNPSEFSGLIREMVKNEIMALMVCQPCTVTKFNNDGKPTVNVIPDINQQRLIKGRELNQPAESLDRQEVEFVPILHLSTTGFSETVPLKAGDKGALFYMDRDLVNWRNDIREPSSARSHDYNDAIFAPGLWPDTKALEGWSDEWFEMRNNTSTTRIALKDDAVHLQAGDSHLILTADGFDVVIGNDSLVDKLASVGVVFPKAEPPERDGVPNNR